MRPLRLMLSILILGGLPSSIASGFEAAPAATDALDSLLLYRGTWNVIAERPWSGAEPGSVDRLASACTRFTAYVACEQSVNGKPLALIVYTVEERGNGFNTRTIAPNGLAGGRGTLTVAGNRWTYLDKPAAGLTGPWSRVENVIVSRNRIEFTEYESGDDGKSWTRTNGGTEARTPPSRRR